MVNRGFGDITQRGSSGAEFTVLGDRVVKRQHGDGTRIMSQGRWLVQHSTRVLPLTFQVYAKSYVMERLIAAPPWALDHKAIFDEMFLRLNIYVWSSSAIVQLELNALHEKINVLLGTYDPDGKQQSLRIKLRTLFDSIHWDELPTCLTHGDPTFDNVMFRERTGELVIIDPIPATPAVPDVRAVDFGKILQSMLGWERIRYGHIYEFKVHQPDVLRSKIPNDNEWTATKFWAIIHLLRAYPYVTHDVRIRLESLIDDVIVLL